MPDDKSLEQLEKQIEQNNKKLETLRAKKEAMGEKIEEVKDEIRALQAETDPLEEELRLRRGTINPNPNPPDVINLGEEDVAVVDAATLAEGQS